MKRKVIKSFLIFLSIFILLLLCGIYITFENTELQLSNYEIINNKIPTEFNDFKIVQISDFHNEKSKRLTNMLINEIKNQKPNIIVITGDLIDSRRTNISVSIDFIKQIEKIAPIYYVTGNHESRINYNDIKEKLIENKVIVLDNKTEILKLGNSCINLIGIDDPNILHRKSISDKTIINEELNNANYDKNNYSILLSHRPEVFDTYRENKLDLVLTGHAHGGQIRLPFFGGMIAPNQGLFPKYTCGKFEEKETTMIISRGIGNSIFPFRINNRPELVIINLKM